MILSCERKCECNQSLCTCIDWKNDDLAVRVNHVLYHFEFQRFKLEYATLEPEEDRRLCKIGRCRTCGGELCIGRELPSQATPDELLTEIYRWMFQMWSAPNERLPAGVNCFRDMFVSLFHESDREFVQEWLNWRAGNENSCTKEES